jgi:type IV secretory pathway TraG/TraD family ATPase VirD4
MLMIFSFLHSHISHLSHVLHHHRHHFLHHILTHFHEHTGGCFLVGFQSKPQLEEIYGRQGAESMLDLFNTKVFFRCTEPSTQTWISKVLGDKEEIEPQENISYGANSMRDGVSLSHHIRQKPLVMPTELSQLEDLECYIKLPGDYP